VGVRFDYIHSYPVSSLLFNFGSVKDFTLDTTPLIDAYAVRPGLYYELPLNRWLRFQANGGPGFYFVNYEFARRYIVPGREDDIRYKVTANRLGVQGGVGLELQLNKRAGFYVEVQGTAPPILLFQPGELATGPVPYGAPTHSDVLELFTPIEFRSPSMPLSTIAIMGIQKLLAWESNRAREKRAEDARQKRIEAERLRQQKLRESIVVSPPK